MCYLHCAGLVSEYLALIEYKSYLPTGCAGFQVLHFHFLDKFLNCFHFYLSIVLIVGNFEQIFANILSDEYFVLFFNRII